MLKSALLALLPAVLFTALPVAARADDLADFTGYVETCVAEVGTIDALVGACVDEQVSAQENHLGDILIETEGTLEAEHVLPFKAAQAAWELYRDKTCAYQSALEKRDAMPRGLFCRLRLVNARISDVLENADFAAFED